MSQDGNETLGLRTQKSQVRVLPGVPHHSEFKSLVGRLLAGALVQAPGKPSIWTNSYLRRPAVAGRYPPDSLSSNTLQKHRLSGLLSLSRSLLCAPEPPNSIDLAQAVAGWVLGPSLLECDRRTAREDPVPSDVWVDLGLAQLTGGWAARAGPGAGSHREAGYAVSTGAPSRSRSFCITEEPHRAMPACITNDRTGGLTGEQSLTAAKDARVIRSLQPRRDHRRPEGGRCSPRRRRPSTAAANVCRPMAPALASCRRRPARCARATP
jgi:hypothetical protein